MNDLNTMASKELGNGWTQVSFWMDSVHYWSERSIEAGDDNGFYEDSIKSAWRMVDRELFGV
jgi:hypothetical protein